MITRIDRKHPLSGRHKPVHHHPWSCRTVLTPSSKHACREASSKVPPTRRLASSIRTSRPHRPRVPATRRKSTQPQTARLPAEIWLEIFELVLEEIPFATEKTLAISTLRRVSRVWNDFVDIAQYSRRMAIIRQGGPLPAISFNSQVDVHVDVTSFFIPLNGPVQKNKTALDRLLSTVIDSLVLLHICRWRSLSIDACFHPSTLLSWQDPKDVINPILSLLPQDGSLQLDSLALLTRGPSYGTVAFRADELRGALGPSLRHLRVVGCEVPWDAAPLAAAQLTDFDLGGCQVLPLSRSLLARLAAATPSLERLALNCVASCVQDRAWPQAVCFPRLRALYVSGTGSSTRSKRRALEFFLGSAPALRKLSLADVDADFWGAFMEVVSDLSAREGSVWFRHLRTLQLGSDASFDFGQDLGVLTAMLTATHVTIVQKMDRVVCSYGTEAKCSI